MIFSSPKCRTSTVSYTHLDVYKRQDVDRLNMSDIVTLLKNDIDGDIYYRWVTGGEDDTVSLVAWTAEGGDVYAYQFTKKDDTYSLITAFVSVSLTKEDVEGKEDGVISGS